MYICILAICTSYKAQYLIGQPFCEQEHVSIERNRFRIYTQEREVCLALVGAPSPDPGFRYIHTYVKLHQDPKADNKQSQSFVFLPNL